MLLAVDIGNTRTKAAVFEDCTLLGHVVFSKNELESNLKFLFEKHKNITHLVVSSVGNEQIDFEIPSNITVDVISHTSAFPFTNKYETPLTLGIDRMVLAAAAVLQFPNRNRLVIDAGTCVTYDCIDDANNYYGGAISPGLKLRYNALNQYTAKLPLLETKEPSAAVGRSTAESMHSGVVNGLVYEIDGFINEYRGTMPNFIIILTGGDGDFLAKRLKNTIFANSNFLLEGLNQIFIQNQK